MIVTVSKGQQVTIPAQFRKALNLRVGSKVEMTRTKERIIIQPVGEELDRLFSAAQNIKPRYGMNAKQMDKLVENEVHR